MHLVPVCQDIKMLSRYLPDIPSRWRPGLDIHDQVPLLPAHWESSFETASMGIFRSWRAAVVGLLMSTETVAFNAPPSVPAWCGKPYMSTYVSILSIDQLVDILIAILLWILVVSFNSQNHKAIHYYMSPFNQDTRFILRATFLDHFLSMRRFLMFLESRTRM